jgi:hypothetical protein
MKNLVFYSSKNSPGKKDATGAFIPGAKAFAKLHGGQLVPVDCTMSRWVRRRKVTDALKAHKIGSVEMVSFFCHGWQSGIQLGFDFRNVGEIAITDALSEQVRVNLYCCSTADGPDIGDESYPDDDEFGTLAPGTDGGFADQLRDSLCRIKLYWCRVIAHRTAGHCDKNPAVVVFEGDGTPEGATEDSYYGGRWIVDPKDALWPEWKRRLRETDLRFRFPLMSFDEIEKELVG